MKMNMRHINRMSILLLLILSFSSFTMLPSWNAKTDYSKPLVDNEEYVQKVNEALAKVIDDKFFKIETGEVTQGDEGTNFSTSAEVFKENNVGIEAVFSTSDKAIKKLKASFAPNTELSSRYFDKLTGRKEKDLFPDAIRKHIYTQTFEITFENNEPKTMSVGVNTNESWNPFDGIGSFAMKGISGVVTLRNPKSKTGMSATLEGNFKIGSMNLSVSGTIGTDNADYVLTTSLSNLNITELVSSIAGSSTLGGISMPQNVFQARINTGSLRIAPGQKVVSITGETSMGSLDLGIQPLDGRQLSFIGGFSLPKNFPFSSIHSSLGLLESFPFENTAFVFASHDKLQSNLPIFNNLKGSRPLQRGFTFVAGYDLKEVGLDELLKVNTVFIYANLPANPLGFTLIANLDMKIPITKDVKFERIDLAIQPKDLSVEIGAALGVQIQTDYLVFGVKGGVEGKDLVLSVAGYMEGSWNNPLGVQGVVVSDVYGKIGLSFRTTPIPLPEIAISGKLKVDEFTGEMTVAMNANNPSESMLDIGFNEINIQKIVEKYCSPSIKNNIPADIRQVALDIGLKDARLTIVPTPVTVAGKYYEAGFRAKGEATVVGQKANLDVDINYNKGVKIYADLNKISHPPYFELTGGRGKPNPFVDILLEASTNSKFQVSGSATLLGLTAETDVSIKSSGFEFFMRGKVFNQFEASVNVYGGDINNGGTIGAKAEMQTNFIQKFTEEASKEIDEATKATQRDIKEAQDVITREQKKMDVIDKDIVAMKRTVQAERDRDRAKLQAAQNDVDKAQGEVNKLQADINRLHKEIAQHKTNIKNKENWVNAPSNPFEVAARGTQSLPYFTEQNAQISQKGIQIAALETAKGTATLTLQGYKETVKLIQNTIPSIPIEADPRVAALYTARDVPKGLMEAAKGVLEVGKGVGVGTLTAAKWIVDNGSQILIVNYAMFEGKVNSMNGGMVKMQVKGTYMGKPFDEKITFNFQSPIKSMEEFANKMM